MCLALVIQTMHNYRCALTVKNSLFDSKSWQCDLINISYPWVCVCVCGVPMSIKIKIWIHLRRKWINPWWWCRRWWCSRNGIRMTLDGFVAKPISIQVHCHKAIKTKKWCLPWEKNEHWSVRVHCTQLTCMRNTFRTYSSRRAPHLIIPLFYAFIYYTCWMLFL